MALTATLYQFDVQLSDVDRNVYQALAIRAARHPSETAEFLCARIVAYCLEYTEGIAFSPGGISDPEDPPLTVRDATGTLRTWIEIGQPDAARVHRASKATPRVVIYTHKDPAALLRQFDGARIHRADAVELYGLDRALLAVLGTQLRRRMAFDLTVTDRHLYCGLDGTTYDGAVTRHFLPT